ncbi:hypothetical protein K505DRAFT_340640 [Melanomma pulvis-pyrius CBS 109.77]|uniref:Zn(2)-C6 fungal-type domain-containing protein n=1 Tax=Melanomma pulvis-pyrius CBS 109.77 TaxID=1314802 RepID=A0A6A6X1I3_9PLEO|nr:hypothetical protein K505DRAFT_340640 [Melanomma pulvis-pyrius CBS 109.77]
MATQGAIPTQKLRSACDNCHSAKVRCSGERTGCNRCNHGGRACRYSVPNISKASKNRPRRRLTQQRDEGFWHGTDESQQLQPHEQWTPLSILSPGQDGRWSEITRDCSLNTVFPNFAGDFAIEMNPSRSTDMSSSLEKLLDFNILTPATSQVDADVDPHNQESNGSAPNVSNLPGSEEVTDIAIAEWVTLVSDLNQKLSQPITPVDIVLSTNSLLLQTMSTSLQHLPSDGSQMAILLLISISLTQVVGLFERSIHDNGLGSKTGPRLLLGSYEVDIESQRLFQTPIVRRELVRVIEAAKNVKTVLESSTHALDSQMKMYYTLIENVEERGRDLAQFLEQPG